MASAALEQAIRKKQSTYNSGQANIDKEYQELLISELLAAAMEKTVKPVS